MTFLISSHRYDSWQREQKKNIHLIAVGVKILPKKAKLLFFAPPYFVQFVDGIHNKWIEQLLYASAVDLIEVTSKLFDDVEIHRINAASGKYLKWYRLMKTFCISTMPHPIHFVVRIYFDFSAFFFLLCIEHFCVCTLNTFKSSLLINTMK